MEMSVVFDNLAQATVEYRATVINPTTEHSTLTEQVALYANRLSIKETDSMALQTAMRNLQGELKNLKSEMYNLKKSSHSDGTVAANKENVRMVPNCKREGQYHHPTWCNTT